MQVWWGLQHGTSKSWVKIKLPGPISRRRQNLHGDRRGDQSSGGSCAFQTLRSSNEWLLKGLLWGLEQQQRTVGHQELGGGSWVLMGQPDPQDLRQLREVRPDQGKSGSVGGDGKHHTPLSSAPHHWIPVSPNRAKARPEGATCAGSGQQGWRPQHAEPRRDRCILRNAHFTYECVTINIKTMSAP